MDTGTRTLGKELIELDSLRPGFALTGFALAAMFGSGAVSFLVFAIESRFGDQETESLGSMMWFQWFHTATWALGLLGLLFGTWMLARPPRGPLPGPSRYGYAALVAGQLLLVLIFGPLAELPTNRITEGAVEALFDVAGPLERILSLAFPIAIAFLFVCLGVFAFRRGSKEMAAGWAGLLLAAAVTWFGAEALVMGSEPGSRFAAELLFGVLLGLLAFFSPWLALRTGRAVWLEAIERPVTRP